jgi:para-nitrobenzyl esterase
MYGIVGQTRPDATDEQVDRDTFVRDALLTLASGRADELWTAVSDVPTTKGIGNISDDPTANAIQVRHTFDGIERP